MAANTFALEAMVLLAASRVDRDKHADIRLEAALCKLWGTERAWDIVNDAVQIRGGRGYETAASLQARGEPPIPVERLLRDSRINLIFEGSSEIMRLFIAREALDPHLKVGAAALNSRLGAGERLRAAVRAAWFYLRWYPRQWLPLLDGLPVARCKLRARGRTGAVLAGHLHYASKASRKLARSIFHALLRHGPKLERQQILLGRFGDIAAELFAITATCLRAEQLAHTDAVAVDKTEITALADYFCRSSRLRIGEKFREIKSNTDRAAYKLGQSVLAGKQADLESGII
jgi:alkylation response protein AidB-like acyl-CoA dehydrogenase